MTSGMILLAALVSISGTGATGATGADARWLPFNGCWSLVEDEVRQPLVVEPGSEASDEAAPAPEGLVCLEPAAQGGQGVVVRTFSGDEAFLEETLLADGERHDVRRGDCTGWQQLDWSKDGRYLFTRAELTCEGRPRSVSGISLIAGMSTWVEIQSVGSGEAATVMIRRYRPAGDEVSELRTSLTEEDLAAVSRARRERFSAEMGIDEIVEANAHVAPEVVEALILEQGGRFPIDADALTRLSDASVSPSIIDLMIAMSFPEHFEVERSDRGGGGGGFSTPFWSSAYSYPYYFAPFGYYYWYAPWDPIYVVRPPVGGEGSVGRVVRGRGYTRVVHISPFEGGGGGRHAKRRGSSSGDGGYKGDSGGSSSSSGTASPQGYSRGGATGRTAKPKKKN